MTTPPPEIVEPVDPVDEQRLPNTAEHGHPRSSPKPESSLPQSQPQSPRVQINPLPDTEPSEEPAAFEGFKPRGKITHGAAAAGPKKPKPK